MTESSADQDTVLTARESLYTLYKYACIANSVDFLPILTGGDSCFIDDCLRPKPKAS